MVIAPRVESVSISSISRVKGIAWNTVARWLKKAVQVCRRFNHRRIAGFAAEELQADEIRTFAGNKKTPGWVFVTIEVWSRLWPSTVTGRRSYRSRRMSFGRLPLIITDGFEFYQKVIRRFFGPACLYGQVLKTRRNDRIIKVERRVLHGAAWRFEDALNDCYGTKSDRLRSGTFTMRNLTRRLLATAMVVYVKGVGSEDTLDDEEEQDDEEQDTEKGGRAEISIQEATRSLSCRSSSSRQRLSPV